MKKFYPIILLVLICIVGFVFRFYKLGEIPNGLYQDETAIGYNAYSILLTGKDEYGKELPLYFKSFGDYKLPIYIYATVISVKLFGLTAFAVRLPSALFGFLTIPLLFFVVRKLTKNNLLSLLTAGIFALNPWSIHYNRATFEVSIALFFFLLGTYCLLESRSSKKGFLLLGTLSFIVGFYTYNLTRLLSPILFVGLLIPDGKKFLLNHKNEVVLTSLLSILLFIPFLLTLRQQGGVTSASGTLIWSSAAVQAPLIEFRSYVSELPPLFQKVFVSIPLLTMFQYLSNIAQYFSIPFFFITGSSHGNHGIGTVGQFYLYELPLFILGITILFRKKFSWRWIPLLWIIATILIASLTREAPHATRSFFLLFPYCLIIALGLEYLIKMISRLKSVYKSLLMLACISIVILSLSLYLTSYFIRFPIAYAKQWRFDDGQVSEFIKTNQSKYEKIVFDKDSGFIYTSLAFYLKYSPSLFQKSVIREPDDSEGFSTVDSFGKFEFRKIDWTHDLEKPKTLIITKPENKPADVKVVQTFYLPKRPVVFSVKQTLLAYPVEEIAYVAIESNQ